MIMRIAALVSCLLGAGLSLASHYGWCSTDACVMYHKIKVYGIGVSLWGLAFFLGLAAVEVASWFTAAGSWLRTLMVAGALGGEAMLMYAQWVMDTYCAICLAVAGVVAVLVVLEVVRLNHVRRMAGAATRFVLSRGALIIAGLAVGFVLARPVPEMMAAGDDYPREELHALLADYPALGVQDAWPKVRVYSDYLCPWCRKQEPVINEILSRNLESLRVYFCDVPVHGKLSQFYITWFLACMLDEANTDEKLVQARELLFGFADDKVTDPGVILDAFDKQGISTSVDPEAIQAAYAAANMAADLDSVISTPTVVVEAKNGKRVILKGGFTAEELIKAIESSS